MKLILGITFLLFTTISNAQVFVPLSYWGCNSVPGSFVNNTQGHFSSGTAVNTGWTGTAMALTVGQTSGTYVSVPFDKKTRCNVPVPALNPFINISWVSDLPYGKELPATSESTADYTALANSTLMNSIAGIWHYNGTGAIANGAAIAAQTGTAGTAVNANGAGMTYTASGKFRSAITFDGTDDHVDVAYTQTNVNDYSISVWFRTASAANNVFVQDRGGGAGRSLTLGIGNNPGGCAAGRISYGLDTNAVYIGKCTTATYNDGNWHHLVGVWDGTAGVAVASAQFTIYVDGVSVATANTSVGTAPNAPLSGLGNTKFGRHEAWGVFLNGSMDEVAIWTRTLSATEVQQLYRRGANRIKIQVRSCASPTCFDNLAWQGYDGTAATFFSELNNNTVPAAMSGNVKTTLPVMLFSDFVSLVLANTQWLQYKLTLESDSTTLVPSVKSVTTSY